MTLFAPGRWSAHWIWPDIDSDTTRRQVVVMRRVGILDVASLPSGWDTSDRPAWAAVRCRRAFARGENGRPEPPSYPVGPHGYRTVSYPVVRDVSLRQRADGGWTSQTLASGTLLVDATIPKGQRLTLTAAEFFSTDGAPAPTPYDAGVTLVGTGERDVMETVDSYGARGFAVAAPPGAIVHGVAVRHRTHPVTGDAVFTCPDPRLAPIWAVGRRTAKLPAA